MFSYLFCLPTDQNHNVRDSAFDGYGTFEHEEIDEESCSVVASLLRQKLKRTGEADLNLEVFLPTDLLTNIAKDIVFMSHCEPYGLKGCVVHMNLQRNSVCHKLGKIECDPDTVATFELYLTLVEDKKCWNNLGDLMVTFLSRCLSDKVVYLSPKYNLEKRKLYRSNSLSS